MTSVSDSRATSLAPASVRAKEIVSLLAVLGLFGLAYSRAIVNMVDSWSTNPTYSYGFIVPGISAWLIWLRRDVLRRTPIASSVAWGSMATAAGLLLLFAGRISTLNFVEELALVPTLCGLTLLLLGWQMFRALAFPIGYLLAMVPFWDIFTARIHPYLQEYSASIGVAVLHLFRIPVLRDGFLLHLPNITLEVARECSGVNNLIAVLCVGVPMTYLSIRQWWKGALIIAAAVGIALLSNGIRVATVSLFAHYGIRGADGDIHGPFALLRTMFVAAVGFMVLFWLIGRFSDRREEYGAQSSPRNSAVTASTGFHLKRPAIAVALLMLFSANGALAWHERAAVPVAAIVDALPLQVGDWRRTGHSSSNTLEALSFDRAQSAVYRSGNGVEVSVFVGYYRRQAEGRELADHRMRPALLDGATTAFKTDLGKGIVVKDLLTARTPRYHVTYWYLVNGRTVAENYEAKLHTAWSSLVRRRSDGAVVVVRGELRPGESIDAPRARVRAFLAAFVSAPPRYLPEGV